MNRTGTLAALLAAVCSLSIGAGPVSRPSLPRAVEGKAEPKEEPRYLGKPTSYWIKKLAEGGPSHRKQAVEALTAIGPAGEKAAPALIRALDDDEADVRVGVLVALRAMGPKARPAIPALVLAVRDRNVDFRTKAIQALGSTRSANKEVVAALVDRITNEQEEKARLATVEALKSAGPTAVKAALPVLGRMSKVPSASFDGVRRDECRVAIIQSLAVAGSDAVPHLTPLLDDRLVQWEAAGALQAIGPAAKAAIPALIAVLKKDSGSRIMNSSGAALAAIGKEAVPALIDALPHERAGRWASDALAAIGPPAIPALRQALQGRDATRRQNAASALGQMGPAAASAVADLRKALADPSPDVCEAAAAALKAIAKVQPKP